MRRWLSLCCALILSPLTFGAEPSPQDIEFFENRIRPVLVQSCYRCHSAGAKRLKGGLFLDTKAGLLKGGDNGPAIVPGSAKKSLLIQALRQQNDLEMPPSGPLPSSVIADFEKWVTMGAPDPRSAKGALKTERKIDLEKGRQFWAFQPPRKVAAPSVKSTWAETDIDRFLLAKLEEHGLKPAPDATPREIARRIYFDLLGLPPTPEQIAKFTANAQKGMKKSIASLVDELLQKPQYGERWGRHWLDLARYAESNGNVRNSTFPHAWRYRDYVIDAFNADKPYPQFIKEQLAGDLLPASSAEKRNANRIATGFLALTSKPRSQNNPNFQMDLVADQIEVTTRAMLALTVACARCHDHKFDPIPTKDYYSLAGIFSSSEMLYGGGGNNMGAAPATALYVLETPGSPVVKQEKPSEPVVNTAQLRQRQKQIQKELKQLRRGKGKNRKPITGKAQAQKVAALTKELQAIRKQLGNGKNRRGRRVDDGRPKAMGVRERARPVDCAVLIRGESRHRGAIVPRGFVQVATIGEAPKINPKQSGRLELAQWIGSEKNPLTARVMANRIWHHLFGNGIVRTPDNFGLNGDRPTHPELLDYLALRLIDQGWSIKKMIRTVMVSRAYRMSSQYNGQAFEKDPENQWLWRKSPRRLDAEALRDAILAVSGQLDLKRPKGSIVSRYGGQLVQDRLSTTTFDPDVTYRSAYLPIVRNGLPEMLRLFDLADPSLVVGKRNVTSVPSQELYLINSPFVINQARAFASRLLEAKQSSSDRIDMAYRLALGRPADKEEIQRGLTFIRMATSSIKETRQAWGSFCQALYVSSEFRYLD